MNVATKVRSGTVNSSGVDPSRAAVITGLGVLAPTGLSTSEHWEQVKSRTSGLGRISRFAIDDHPSKVAGEISRFDPAGIVPRRLQPQTDRWTHLALAAAVEALASSEVDLKSIDEYRMAVMMASSSGGNAFGQNEMTALYRNGPNWVTAFQSIAWFYAATTGQISIRHTMRGPCGVVCAEQAGGLDAIAAARRLIRTGSDLVVSGGTDSALCPYAHTAQWSSGLLSTDPNPSSAYRPFTEGARGYVAGEGGAVLVIEDAQSARERGAAPYAVIAGHASGFNPAFPKASSEVIESVLRRALADAEVLPDAIDVVFADATGTRDADAAEATALARVFGEHEVPVTAPKVLTGRLYGGGSSLDTATALLAMRDGLIPATYADATLATWCSGIDLVIGESRPTTLDTALVLACGYGGFVSALVLRHLD